ncbi:MAG: PKD domain-containing protein, partial [Sphingomonadales bacterium]
MKSFCKLTFLLALCCWQVMCAYAQVHPDEVNCTHQLENMRSGSRDSVLRTTNANGEWVLQSRSGAVLTSRGYEYIGLFNAGLAVFQTSENKWGFMDSYGKEVIPAVYTSVRDFNAATKKAIVLYNDQWVEIDKSGVVLRTNGNNPDILSSASSLQNRPVSESGMASTEENRNLFPCPINISLENGSFAGWQCYVGRQQCVGGLNQPTLSASSPTNNRHTILASSTARDYFGNFPLAAPDGSNYFVRLGNTNTRWEAESIAFPFTIPAGADNYSITFYYAVVFQNPSGHSFCEQPRFMARVKDAVTGAFLNCSVFDFTAGSGLPGFFNTTADPLVRCKPWDTAYINLGAYQNRSVILEFVTVDCGQGAHWGYAYVDVKNICDIAAQGITTCTPPNTTTLSGPPGFQTYSWWNQNFTTQVGTGNPLVLTTNPPVGTQYNLIVVPYSGLGCRDTLPAITTKLAPTARFTAPTEQCFRGNQFTFTSTSTSTSPSVLTSTLWRFSDGQTISGTSVTRSFAAAGTYSVTLIVSNNFNCADSITYTVRVKETPTASFVAPPDQCLRNNLFNFSSTSVISNGTISNFNWNFGAVGGTATGTNVTYSYASAGSYTVRLITIASNGCADTATRT